MKPSVLFVVLCGTVLRGTAFPQTSGRATGPTGPVAGKPPAPVGALGGPYASVGISRPLGGIAPPSIPSPATRLKTVKPHSSTTSALRYLGPVYYVPNAEDWAQYGEPVAAPTAWQPAFSEPSPPRQSEYRESPAPPQQLTQLPDPSPDHPPDAAPTYLVQFRDRTMKQVQAYWIEGDTLHYVTLQGRGGLAHNQASLNLVDMDSTLRLNSGSMAAGAIVP